MTEIDIKRNEKELEPNFEVLKNKEGARNKISKDFSKWKS